MMRFMSFSELYENKLRLIEQIELWLQTEVKIISHSDSGWASNRRTVSFVYETKPKTEPSNKPIDLPGFSSDQPART